MELNDYQERAMRTCTPESNNKFYMLLGLSEETGELCGKFAKAIRSGKYNINQKTGTKDFHLSPDEQQLIKKECGDVLWMLAGVCTLMGWDLNSIAALNLKKLAQRQKNGTIVGDGDER